MTKIHRSPVNPKTESSRPMEKNSFRLKTRLVQYQRIVEETSRIPLAQIRPSNLPRIDGVTNQRPAHSNVNVFGSHDRPLNTTSRDNINLERPAFGNRSDNPYTRADQNRMDALNKFLRDVKAILNKVTPQNL